MTLESHKEKLLSKTLLDKIRCEKIINYTFSIENMDQIKGLS